MKRIIEWWREFFDLDRRRMDREVIEDIMNEFDQALGNIRERRQ